MHNKKDMVINGFYVPGTIPHGMDKLTITQLFYKKLGSYLLLLYQAYLKGETVLEPNLKMALWRMVKSDEEFPVKIRMTQLDYLGTSADKLDASWDEAKDVLFPSEAFETKEQLTAERTKIIKGYKETVAELLTSDH